MIEKFAGMVRVSTRREVLSYMDEYLENLRLSNEGWDIDGDYLDGTHVEILYGDGTSRYVDRNYDPAVDGKIRRQHIASIVYDGMDDTIAYGDYTVSETGTVHID